MRMQARLSPDPGPRGPRVDAQARGFRSTALVLLWLGAGSCIGPGLEPPGDNDSLSEAPVVPPPTTGSRGDAGIPRDPSGTDNPPGAVEPGTSTPADAGTGFGNTPPSIPGEELDEDAGS